MIVSIPTYNTIKKLQMINTDDPNSYDLIILP